VATQSFVDPRYGPLGLELMRLGRTAPEALRALVGSDADSAVRQVAMVDALGRVAAYTGARAIVAAGHKVGAQYSVQANLMDKPTVWPAMAAAFEASRGDLAERLLAALEAAEKEGGDIRGSQSAAILVRPGANPLDFQWDLRVDNHPEPLAELRELLNIRLAARVLNSAEAAARAADTPEARAKLLHDGFAGANALAPSDEQTFWFAVTGLAQQLGDVDAALTLLDPIFEGAPLWRGLLLRLELPGLEALKEAARVG
jgi:uncharacterized Ntn-hydrolase superfamily protein